MRCRRPGRRESLCSIGHSPAQRAQLTLTPDAARDRDFGLGCASCVAMMQAADHREGDDLPLIGGLSPAGFGGVLVEREVGPGSVIVLEVVPKDTPQVLLAKNDDVVQAFPPKGPNHALAVRILPRGTRRGEDLFDSQRMHSTNGSRACCQSDHRPQSATQNARSALVSLGRLVVRFRMASCCRKARFSIASSRCGRRLDLAVASRAHKR